MAQSVRRFTDPAIFVVAVVAVWWSVTELTGIHTVLLPSPLDVWSIFSTRFGLLLSSMLDTYLVTLQGFAIGSAVGVLAAIVVSSSRRVRAAVYPFLVTLYVMPKAILIPLFLLWFGLGDLYKLLVIALLVFFPVCENVTAGIRGVEREMLELARISQATKGQILRKVTMPYTLPFLAAGLRVGLTEAFIGAVLAEVLAPRDGIGSRIAESVATSNTQFIIAGIVFVAAFGIGTYFLLHAIERRLLFWHH